MINTWNHVGLICGLLFLSAVGTADAHPFHVSLTEAEINRKTNQLEVALRVDPEHLETAISRFHKQALKLDARTGGDRRLVKYLEHVFLVKNTDGKPCKLEWVGKEITSKDAWLYFAASLPDASDDVSINNRILFDLLDDQVNTVNIRDGKSLQTVISSSQPQPGNRSAGGWQRRSGATSKPANKDWPVGLK